MTEIQIIELGIVTVDYGIHGDPDRARNILPGPPSPVSTVTTSGTYPLDFPQLDNWPLGETKEELFAIKAGVNFDGFKQVNKWIVEVDFTPKGFPHLIAVSIRDDLYKLLAEHRVRLLSATDPASFQLGGGANFYTPYVRYESSKRREVRCHTAKNIFYACGWFLVGYAND